MSTSINLLRSYYTIMHDIIQLELEVEMQKKHWISSLN